MLILCKILSSLTENVFHVAKKLAFGVSGLRTSFGPTDGKRLTKPLSPEP